MPVKASWYTLYFLILKLFLPIYLFFFSHNYWSTEKYSLSLWCYDGFKSIYGLIHITYCHILATRWSHSVIYELLLLRFNIILACCSLHFFIIYETADSESAHWSSKRKQYAAKVGKRMTCVWGECIWRSYIHTETWQKSRVIKVADMGLLLWCWSHHSCLSESQGCVHWPLRLELPACSSAVVSPSLIRCVMRVCLGEEHSVTFVVTHPWEGQSAWWECAK